MIWILEPLLKHLQLPVPVKIRSHPKRLEWTDTINTHSATSINVHLHAHDKCVQSIRLEH